MIYQLFTSNLPILIPCCIANHLPVMYLSSTTGIFMLLSLPMVDQSFANQPRPFCYIDRTVAVVINCSNFLYRCFTNHYQSDQGLHISSLTMTTNILLIYHFRL